MCVREREREREVEVYVHMTPAIKVTKILELYLCDNSPGVSLMLLTRGS